MGVKKVFKKVSSWELWNFKVLYAPISIVWLWYCLRSRSFWFFTSSNPTITFGGFEGEGKKEIYNQLPQQFIPRTIYVQPGQSADCLKNELQDAGFNYPFVVKPDVGMKGILFRVIQNEDQLIQYHAHIPVEYIVQEKVDYPVEVSVFYIRYPWKKTGEVTGFIKKELLQVKGDGNSTLEQLILDHPRARYRMDEMRGRHGDSFSKVLPAGEIFYLSFAGNHNRGANFINLADEIDGKLVSLFDELSLYTKSFFYGRYDIKTACIADLKAGRNFRILEYNGSGAEPNHIYDNGMRLGEAYKTILYHWNALYRISAYNHRHGSPHWPLLKGLKYLRRAKRYFRMLEKYD